MNENQKIREELLKSVEDLSDRQLNEKVEAGSWTIMQVLDHLYLMEMTISKSIAGELANEKSEAAPLKPIHLTVNRSTKVAAPSFVKPSDDFISLAEMKGKLSESRKTLIRVTEGASEQALEQKSFPHPIFGPLSLKQWTPFVGYHEKRHMAQIEELKGKLS
ncbi:DinB family protein [Peribacillus cavernae]|uniref:DinB family protein n=1 Tax=Peribacillus cavernae TaxID=1674310 RepID=A0A3S0U506_9BACI|nr:DinB family protein [Peribacillus cavernae]MDQ0217348.1 putative damage-inducible protein DinB [Peribacillus cavernae]RUQ30199.1 DinB family protein [Peribacillus cavernae]